VLFRSYGVTAYTVEQRQREIAVRSALGAPRATLVKLFVVDGGRVVALGVTAGIIGAGWIGRLLRHQVFGVGQFDAVTLVGASLIVVVACLAASWLPARRAAATDAAIALRSE